jgi:GntR family transcriptional regulator
LPADPSPERTPPKPRRRSSSEGAEALWSYLASRSPGDRLPPEPELASKIGMSRSKLRELLRTLADQGVITRAPGAGTTLVHPVQLHADVSINMGVTDLIRAHGLEPGTQELRVERRAASEAESRQLGIRSGDPLWVIDRVRTANGKPIAMTIDLVPAHILDAAMTPLTALAEDSLYQSLSDNGYPIQRGVARISPLQADEETARRLAIQPGELLLHLEQVDYDETGKPLLLASESFVAAAFSLGGVRRPRA